MTTRDELELLRAVRDAVPPPSADARSDARDRVLAAARAASTATVVREPESEHTTDRVVRPLALDAPPRRPRRALVLAAAAVAALVAAGIAWQALGPRPVPAPLIDEGRDESAPLTPLPVERTDAVDVTGEGTPGVDGVAVVRPTEAGPWPVVVLLGGYRTGNVEDLATAVAEQGAVVHLVDVVQEENENGSGRTLSPAVLREIAQRTTCSLRHVTATTATHGGDPEDVVVVTHEASGWTTALALLADAQVVGNGPCTVADDPAVPRAFVALGSFWFCEGVIDCPFLGDEAEALSPLTYVDRRPELAFHVRAPAIGDWGQPAIDRQLIDALQEAGHVADLEVVEGVSGIAALVDVGTPTGDASVDLVLEVVGSSPAQDE